MKAVALARRVDRAIIDFTRAHGLTVLRIALGIVFVWFGALKIAGHSPVADLVERTAYFLPPRVAVVGIGVLETIIGIGLLARIAMRLTLGLFFVQMCATFLTLITRPDLLIEHGDPLVLSIYGEFLLKNLVLIAAGIAIVGSVHKTSAVRR